MDLRQLRYFVTLADTQNFHRAAEKLNISQPPLTVAIRKLEEDLGTALFVRGPRGVTLTVAGEAALESARAALEQAEDVRQAVRQGSRGERGRLTIGYVGSAIHALIPRLVPLYRRRYPLVDLILEETTSADIMRRIRTGQFDVGLVRLPLLELTEIETQVVETDELMAAIPATNSLARRQTLPLAMLAREPFILYTPVSVLHATILMACQRVGFMPRVAQEATQVHTIMSLVQSGLGVALVPSRTTRYIPDGVKLLPLADPIHTQTGIALQEANPFARNFREIAIANIDIR